MENKFIFDDFDQIYVERLNEIRMKIEEKDTSIDDFVLVDPIRNQTEQIFNVIDLRRKIQLMNIWSIIFSRSISSFEGLFDIVFAASVVQLSIKWKSTIETLTNNSTFFRFAAILSKNRITSQLNSSSGEKIFQSEPVKEILNVGLTQAASHFVQSTTAVATTTMLKTALIHTTGGMTAMAYGLGKLVQVTAKKFWS